MDLRVNHFSHSMEKNERNDISSKKREVKEVP